MKLNKEQIIEMENLAKPLIRFIRDHGNPHCEIVVTQTSVDAKEAVAYAPMHKFEPLHYA